MRGTSPATADLRTAVSSYEFSAYCVRQQQKRSAISPKSESHECPTTKRYHYCCSILAKGAQQTADGAQHASTQPSQQQKKIPGAALTAPAAAAQKDDISAQKYISLLKSKKQSRQLCDFPTDFPTRGNEKKQIMERALVSARET